MHTENHKQLKDKFLKMLSFLNIFVLIFNLQQFAYNAGCIEFHVVPIIRFLGKKQLMLNLSLENIL